MDRNTLYFLYKDLLCRYGAIPQTEEAYEDLIKKLLDIYDKKNEHYERFYY